MYHGGIYSHMYCRGIYSNMYHTGFQRIIMTFIIIIIIIRLVMPSNEKQYWRWVRTNLDEKEASDGNADVVEHLLHHLHGVHAARLAAGRRFGCRGRWALPGCRLLRLVDRGRCQHNTGSGSWHAHLFPSYGEECPFFWMSHWLMVAVADRLTGY